MNVEVLHTDACPNRGETGRRLAQALRRTGHAEVEVSYRLIGDSETATRTHFAGSPTVVVDGADLFPSDGATSDLACRIYATPEGLAGQPTQEQLVDAIRRLE
jgi:hypothetical protein